MIRVYTRPGCQPCKYVKTYLYNSGLSFEIIDVSIDRQARDYLLDELRVTTVPVVTHPFLVEPIVGFAPDALKALVKLIEETDYNEVHDYVFVEDDDE